MKRVAFVTHCLALGGTEKHLGELILRSDDARVQPSIVCLGPDVYTPVLRAGGRGNVAVHEVRPRTLWDYWRVFRWIRPHVVVFVNGKLGLFPWCAYAAARLAGAERVVGIEHLQGERPPEPVMGRGIAASVRRGIGWRARYMLARRLTGYLSRPTICVSDAVRRTLIEDYGYPPARTLTIHNGIDVQYHQRRSGAREAARTWLGMRHDEPVLVCVARLAPLKRVDLLLEALAIVRRSGVPCRSIIVGDGPLREALGVRADALGLSDRVRFVGHQDDVRPYLEAADAYVTSSEREGFGLALAEAMAYELPCVATDIGGHDELLADKEAGILVPPRCSEELARGILSVLDHPEHTRAMAKAARRVIHERFNIDRMVAQIWNTIVGTRS